MIKIEQDFILECERGHRVLSLEMKAEDHKPSLCPKCGSPLYVNWTLTEELRKFDLKCDIRSVEMTELSRFLTETLGNS